MRKNHIWDDELRAIIRRDYKHTNESCRHLSVYLSQYTGKRITECAVKGQIQIMGIGKSDDRHPWSPKEDAKLKELIPQYCLRKVAHIMHRSINSVSVRARRINASRRCRDGWFTKREVMAILGHDHKWVQRRIDSRALPATYHYETKPCQLGGTAWHIDEKDLKNFIKTYPEVLSGCNIDIIMIVDIISGVNNNNHGESEVMNEISVGD